MTLENNNVFDTPRILNKTNPELHKFSEDLASIEDFLLRIEKNESESKIKPFFLSTKEVARILNLSVRTLISYREKGIIPFVRIGSSILYPVDRLKNYLSSHTIVHCDEPNNETTEQSCQ